MTRRPASWALPRLVRISLWSLLGLVVLVIVGGAVVILSFDPDSLKPRIIAAVKQATGRDLTLQGHIRMGLSLRPTLVVQGVSFANPPGFSRPQMATLEQLDLTLALVPLLSHRVEIDRLVLVKPDIIVETDAQGRPNWQFTPEPKSPTLPSTGAVTQGGPASPAATRFHVADVSIQNGTLTWRDGRTARSALLSLPSLQATAASPDANLHLSMSADFNGTPFTLAGELGPLDRLVEPESGATWPVQAHLEAAGAKLDVDGTFSQPQEGRGFRMKLTGNIPDLSGLAPLLPGAILPPLRDVSLAVQIADTGRALPELSALTLHVGSSDLTGMVPGLRLDKLDVSAPRLDQPVQVSVLGSYNNSPVTLSGSLGAPATLMPGAKAAAPIPLDLSVQALGSSLVIKGTAGQREDGRPSVQAEAVCDKIDLDSLLAAFRRAPVPATAAAVQPAATAKSPAPMYVIPDTPIPFEPLHLADADVKLSIAQLVWGGATYRAIATHLDLHDAKLRFDPFSADLPGGHVDAVFSADATQTTPTVALRLNMPALVLQQLFAAIGQPDLMTGNLAVQADLRGAGATPHAIASGVDGTLTLALANGTLDNRTLGSTLGSVLRQINLLDLVGRGGTTQIQCFVARLDANHGIAALRSLVLASSLLTVDGNGSLNLGTETMDLRIRSQARIGGTGIVLPFRVSGSFRSPSAAPDAAAAIAGNAGTIAGVMAGKANPFEVIIGALGGKQVLQGASIDCGSALAAARVTAESPVPPAPAARPSPRLPPQIPNVGRMLQQLFR